MNLKNIIDFKIFLLLYVSLLIGLFFNEDFTLGYKVDHFIHLDIINRFDNNFLHSLINFNNKDINFTTSHSPFFYIVFLFIKKISFSNDLIFRLINLHISLLLPYLFYLILKTKNNIKNDKIKYLLPGLFFISPYFRSGSLWIGSENISLIFLFASFYFYLLFLNKKNKKFYLITLNIICLSIASYLRPIYCIFSIYFFLILFKDLLNINKLFQYILINLILAFPAFYYVFILGIDFISLHVASEQLNISRFTNQFSIVISILFYYSVPFLIFNYNEIIKNILKIENFLLFIIYTLFLIIFFNYSVGYGGGIFYRISQFLFSNNYFFIFFSGIGFVYFKIILFDKFKNNLNDIILFLTLIFLEIDTTIFHETFDILIYLIFYIMFTNKHFFEFTNNLNAKKIIFLFLFSLSFYSLTIIKNFI
tara:strand:+ start:389 stop:1654 length:1266 start_codon:yes stop_codon:yes gene_type:complete